MTATIPLGELVTIRGGGTPSRGVPEFWNGNVRWATVKDFESTELAETQESITEEGVRQSATNVIPAGCVVVPTRMAVGKAAINTIDLAINQDLKALLPTGEVDERFLLHFILSKGQFLESRAQGATVKGIKLDLLRSLPFPRISRAQQRRLAAILDKADAIRRKREQAIDLSDQFLRSLFLEMFGDPVTNSKSLLTRPLAAFGRIVTGNTPPRANPRNYGSHIEWIKSDNINTSEHLLTEATEHLSIEGARLGRVVPTGSVLVICIAGSPSSIGKAAIADRDVALNQQINAITPNAEVNQFFLYTQFIVGQLLVQRASTNSMKGMVNKGAFQKIEFLCPTPEEQSRFGKYFESYINNNNTISEARDLSANLFSSLSQRAFRGGL